MGNNMNQEFTLIPLTGNTTYFINTNGDVYSLKRNKILKPYINIYGYCQVVLRINNKPKVHKVHRLVGYTFIPNLENKLEINHKNGIKTDNRIENIEWSTRRENVQHAYDTNLKIGMKGDKNPNFGRTGEKHPLFGKTGAKHPKSKQVMCIETGEIFDSTMCVYRKYGYHGIAAACRGKRKSASGYTWRYL